MVSPSFEGTSAVSLTSCVLTDILTTFVNGRTKWTPEVRMLGETLPKKSLTPTSPAGITVRGLPMRNSSRMATPMTP